MINVPLFKRVCWYLHQRCDALAARVGDSLQEKELAAWIFHDRASPQSRATAWSQFKRDKFGGAVPMSIADVARVLGGYRQVLELYLARVDAREPAEKQRRLIEADAMEHFGLRGDRLVPAHFLLHGADDPDDRTPALARHDPVFMRAMAAAILDLAREVKGDAFPAVCEHMHAKLVAGRPVSADLSRFRILGDSTVFDNSDWVHVHRPEDLRNRPIQPCYGTRHLRVAIDDPEARSIAFEFNTGGFGVIPVRLPGEPRFRFLVQDGVHMLEAPVPTRTTYVEFDLPPDAAGRELEFVVRTIIFNGVQDSFHPMGGRVEPTDVEWLGKRVFETTEDADLTVILPLQPPHSEWRFIRRPESANRDIIEQPDDRERIFKSSSQRTGSLTEGAKAIWKLPRVQEPTIFSFQWKWD